MNTIYYANLRTGQRKAVKVTQKPWYGARATQGNKKRPYMAEADERMLKAGFVRWPRKKEIPGFQEIRLPRAA